MATGFTSYGLSVMLRSLFTPDVAASPSSVQFAACYSIPVNNAASFQLDEPPFPPEGEDVGYSRAGIDLTSEAWGVSDFGEIYNIGELELGVPTVYWGALYGWAIVDEAAEECLVVGELVDPIDPVVGQNVIVPVASLVIGMYG